MQPAAHRRLARAAFLGALCLTGIAHFRSPAWAEALRAEGYYADLAVAWLDGGMQVVAGDVDGLHLRVANQGPADASGVLLRAGGPADMALLAPGCSGSTGALSCALSPLENAGQRTLQLAIAPAPHARGIAAIGAYVDAEQTDPDEGDNLAVTWVDVVGYHDIAASLPSEAPELLPDGSLRWVVRFENAGPSTVLGVHPAIGVYQAQAPTLPRVTCSASAGARCASGDIPGELPPGGVLDFVVEASALASTTDYIHLHGALWYAQGWDHWSNNDYVYLYYASRIFSDDFGYW